MVLARPAKLCNFVDWKVGRCRSQECCEVAAALSCCMCCRTMPSLPSLQRHHAAGAHRGWLPHHALLPTSSPSSVSALQDQKIVYKRYASLYFIAGIDQGALPGRRQGAAACLHLRHRWEVPMQHDGLHMLHCWMGWPVLPSAAAAVRRC